MNEYDIHDPRLFFYPSTNEFRVGHQRADGTYFLWHPVAGTEREELEAILGGVVDGGFICADATGLGLANNIVPDLEGGVDLTDHAAAMLAEMVRAS